MRRCFGRICVRKDGGLYGYVDAQGRMAVKPQFEEAKLFREGIALVKKGGRWCYIDRKGKLLYEPKDDRGCFHHRSSSHRELLRLSPVSSCRGGVLYFFTPYRKRM